VLISLCSLPLFTYTQTRAESYPGSAGSTCNLPDFEASLNPVVFGENLRWIHFYGSLECLKVPIAFMNSIATAIWFNPWHLKVLYCV